MAIPAEDGTYFLPRLIRFARTGAGLSQRELAAACNVVQPSVVAWESGRRAISEETLVKVAAALGHPDVERFLCSIVRAWLRARGRPTLPPRKGARPC